VTPPRERPRRQRGAPYTGGEPAAHRGRASGNKPQLLVRHGQNDRAIALGRKNHLFAGSDGGGQHWAVIASLIATCKLLDIDPNAYLTDVLTKIVARHPMNRLDELLPFAYVKIKVLDRAAA
jgi:hypothetical protein